MRVESDGFQRRQWKLYPWVVSLLAEHVPCELVSDKLLGQGVPPNRCPVFQHQGGVLCRPPIYSLSFMQAKLTI